VTSPRHKAVEPARRPRPPRPRLLRLALPATAATLVTVAVVGVAVSRGQHQPVQADDVAAKPVDVSVPAGGGDDSSVYQADRIKSFSRSTDRVTLQKKPKVVDHEYQTAALNLWPAPREKGKPLDVLKSGGTVAVTGVRKSGFAQILHDGQVRWVNQQYLSEKKPVAPKASAGGGTTSTTAGVSSAPCPDGSATESGLTPSAVTLFRAVCNAFPALSSYGGYDAHGEHASGKAIDFMINGDSSLGQAVADWARAHAAELNLYDVIWQQHIWTPERSSEGWRSMPDRGSPTANHFDHVHISVN
jgi:hypothetical protein